MVFVKLEDKRVASKTSAGIRVKEYRVLTDKDVTRIVRHRLVVISHRVPSDTNAWNRALTSYARMKVRNDTLKNIRSNKQLVIILILLQANNVQW